jgi:hypothetical protein
VLEYLGRYTHRVAIANSRLVDFADGTVTFKWKDYRHESRNKVMTLDAQAFIRRVLLHVLPLGFQRIRHYGLLANCHCQAKLARCREPEITATATSASPGCLSRLPALRMRADGLHRNASSRKASSRTATRSTKNDHLQSLQGRLDQSLDALAAALSDPSIQPRLGTCKAEAAASKRHYLRLRV